MILIDRPFSNIFYLLILLICLWGRNSSLHFTDEEAVLRECKWTGEWPVVEHWFQIKYFLVKTTLFFCMSFCSDLKIQEVILDLNTRSYKIMRLPRWLSGKKESAYQARDAGLIPGLGNSLRKELSTHSSILPGKSHGQRNLVGYRPWGRRVGHDWATKHST